MLEIIKENKKIFTVLLVAAFLIIIGIIWLPEKNIKLSHYMHMTEEEIDLKAVKQYGDELQFALYSQDMVFLRETVLLEYLEYNKIQMEDYNEWLLENNILTTNITFGKTTKYKYGNHNIYSIETMLNGKNQKINIIETYPESWKYTFDTFVSFDNEEIKKEYDGYGVIINSIYQDINYIKFDVSIYVDQEDSNDIDVSKSDSIKLVMNDTTSFIMATNNYTSENVFINGKKYITMDCIFNIPITNQKNITSIVFNSHTIDNDGKSIEVKLDL